MRSIQITHINSYTLKKLSIAMISILLCLSAHALDELHLELMQIKKERQVVTTTKVKGEVWPEVTVKAYIKARPLEAASIFAAFDYQKSYVPNIMESRVIKEKFSEKGNEIQVKYLMDMPWPVSNSEYINTHQLSYNQVLSRYQVQWSMITSDSADALRGFASFAPFPNDPTCTLMIYKAHVSPKSFLAGALRKFMIRDVKSSVQATIDEIEKLKSENSKLIIKYSDIFNKILSKKKAFL